LWIQQQSFDDQFLRGLFEQNGDKYFGSIFWSDSSDVMVLASECLKLVRHKMENFQLKTVAKTLGIEVVESELHDALYDVELTIKIYQELRKTYFK
jgi:DNA polymerase III subunit epsilon